MKPTGLLECLDEESKLPNPSPKHFTNTVHLTHRSHPRLATSRKSQQRHNREMLDDEGFLIRHYAGEVCYSTAHFLEKNNDALHVSLEMLMEGST